MDGGDVAAELRPEHRRRMGGIGGGARPYRRQGELRLAPWVEKGHGGAGRSMAVARWDGGKQRDCGVGRG